MASYAYKYIFIFIFFYIIVFVPIIIIIHRGGVKYVLKTGRQNILPARVFPQFNPATLQAQ